VPREAPVIAAAAFENFERRGERFRELLGAPA
jgi:hypothetical protein